MIARRAQSDFDILREAAVESAQRWRDRALALYHWFDDVAWDQLVCRAIGHKKPLVEFRKRSTHSKSWVYEMRCGRCLMAIPTATATYVAHYDPVEVARRQEANQRGRM